MAIDHRKCDDFDLCMYAYRPKKGNQYTTSASIIEQVTEHEIDESFHIVRNLFTAFCHRNVVVHFNFVIGVFII